MGKDVLYRDIVQAYLRAALKGKKLFSWGANSFKGNPQFPTGPFNNVIGVKSEINCLGP